jgi:hypothetical protein
MDHITDADREDIMNLLSRIIGRFSDKEEAINEMGSALGDVLACVAANSGITPDEAKLMNAFGYGLTVNDETSDEDVSK